MSLTKMSGACCVALGTGLPKEEPWLQNGPPAKFLVKDVGYVLGLTGTSIAGIGVHPIAKFLAGRICLDLV